MTEGFSLLLVLVVVYLSDCVILLHRQAVALVMPWRAWRIRLAGRGIGTENGTLLGLQPLPPLGALYETAQWPISPAEDGVCAFRGVAYPGTDRAPQSGRFIAYRDVKEVRADGHDLVVNGSVFASTGSYALAAHLASLVKSVVDAPREKRPQMISAALEATLNVDAARDAAAALAAGTRGLRRACATLWTYFFVACPVVTSVFGLGWLLLPLAGVGLLVHVPTVAWFAKVFGRLHPAERGKRVEHVFRMSLCPPLAIRAVDAVTRHGLALYHPVAAAVALCPAEDAAAFAGAAVRDLRHPLPSGMDGDAAAAESSFRSMLLARIQAVLAARGVTVRDVPAPDRTPTDARAFCPRCLNIFTVEDGVCQDCYGTKLNPLPARAAAALEKP